MEKKRKKSSSYNVFARGVVTALGIYVLGIFLLALFILKGILPETSSTIAIGILALLAAMCSVIIVIKKATMEKLPAALITIFIFAGILTLVGLSFGRIAWAGQGGIILLCVLGGGIMGLCVGQKKRRVGKRLRK